MDGEILISLKPKHTPTAALMAKLRRELPKRFAGMQFFFQPADIVDQVLNFGQPAPIDIRVSGPNDNEAYELASKLAHDLQIRAGGRGFACLSGPECAFARLSISTGRLPTEFGIDQQDIASNVLVATNSSAQTTPNFWVDPHNNVSYPLVVQMPTYRINSTQDLRTMPVTVGKRRIGRPAFDECRQIRPQHRAYGRVAI